MGRCGVDGAGVGGPCAAGARRALLDGRDPLRRSTRPHLGQRGDPWRRRVGCRRDPRAQRARPRPPRRHRTGHAHARGRPGRSPGAAQPVVLGPDRGAVGAGDRSGRGMAHGPRGGACDRPRRQPGRHRPSGRGACRVRSGAAAPRPRRAPLHDPRRGARRRAGALRAAGVHRPLRGRVDRRGGGSGGAGVRRRGRPPRRAARPLRVSGVRRREPVGVHRSVTGPQRCRRRHGRPCAVGRRPAPYDLAIIERVSGLAALAFERASYDRRSTGQRRSIT